jgi:hypothetical protein
MFKRTLLPLITIASLSAAEEPVDHAAPRPSSFAPDGATADMDEAAPTRSTAQSIMIIISHLEKGILIMEQDTNKECGEFMRNIAAEARTLLVKLVALMKTGKLAEYEDGLKAELVRELYQAYKRFNDMLEATYNQTTAPVDTATDDAPVTENQPTT